MSIKSVMLPNYFILFPPSLPALNFPSIRVFSNELARRIRWPKYRSFSFSNNLSNEYSGLISFKVECSPRDSQESSLAPQWENINSSVLRLLYGPILTTEHDSWKNHSFDYMEICQQNGLYKYLKVGLLDHKVAWNKLFEKPPYCFPQLMNSILFRVKLLRLLESIHLLMNM